MERAVECTHCRVVMTSWSAPGSTIRYYQCPFCARTHSSLYSEVFRRNAGARLVDAPARASTPEQIPMASPDDVRWARVKATAKSWFARLEADEQRCGPAPRRRAAGDVDTTDCDPSNAAEVRSARPVRSVKMARRGR